MKRALISTTGSLITAVIASLCCIGPAIVVLLGVGSIGAFAVFELYRPYLIGATVALLALAFYLVYKKREVQCEDGTCNIQSAGTWTKAAVWLAAFLAIAAIAFPHFDLVPPTMANQTVRSRAQVELTIDGMDCKGCAAGLEASLGRMKGVHKASIFYDQQKAVIEYDPSIVQLSFFIHDIEENGFKATIIESTKGANHE